MTAWLQGSFWSSQGQKGQVCVEELVYNAGGHHSRPFCSTSRRNTSFANPTGVQVLHRDSPGQSQAFSPSLETENI
uniref:Uncharacterized protein n=1 Tax=Phasianus colchicus TaxID=9054 RepID=A0A669PUJ5_PHACC